MLAAETDFPQLALSWYRAGRGAALVTLVEAWPGAPQPVGAQMVVDADGAAEGRVCAGCVEEQVARAAAEAVRANAKRLIELEVSDAEAQARGLACGGALRLLAEPVGAVVPASLLEKLVEARQLARPIAYVTDVHEGTPRLAAGERFADRLREDRPGLEDDGRSFVAVHNAPLRLVMVGAVEIAQHLAPMALACGHTPVIIDPRPGFALAEAFSGLQVRQSAPDEALLGLRLNARTALVTLAHDPALDDPALVVGLETSVYYLGALGSRKSHAMRSDRLRDVGFTDKEIARIHAPVGLDLGGRHPGEIATSIMAGITQSLRQPSPDAT